MTSARWFPHLPHQCLDSEKGRNPGTAMLPRAAGRGVADSLLFTSCWCFGESRPLKTAGPMAAVSEGWSEAGPEQRERGTEQGQVTGRSVNPASRKLLSFHFYKLAPH